MKKTYEQEIETLIPMAETAANIAVGYIGTLDPTAEEKWNRIFHSTIDRLAMLRGIRRMAWQA